MVLSRGDGRFLPPLHSLAVGFETFSWHALGHVVGVHEGSLNAFGNHDAVIHCLPKVVALSVVVSGSGRQTVVSGDGHASAVVAEGC